MFYEITGASILVLEIVVMLRQGEDYTATSNLLQKMAMLAEKHLRNRKIPGSLRKWATLISELPGTTGKFCTGQQRNSVRCVGEVAATKREPAISDAQLLTGLQHAQTLHTSTSEQSDLGMSTSALSSSIRTSIYFYGLIPRIS